MPKPPTTGRESIYRGKDLTRTYKGCMTPTGRRAFERARKALAKLHGRATASDGDTIEALARGDITGGES